MLRDTTVLWGPDHCLCKVLDQFAQGRIIFGRLGWDVRRVLLTECFTRYNFLLKHRGADGQESRQPHYRTSATAIIAELKCVRCLAVVNHQSAPTS